jgi:predicted aspartyl protease/tetratricopeptide (TPR) repeat protein
MHPPATAFAALCRAPVLRVPSALALLFAVALAALAWPAPVRAACNLQQMTLSVRVVDRRAVATLTINGSPVQLMVDSGAFYSMLSPSTAAQLNLSTKPLPPGLRVEGYTGRIEARRTRVEKLGLLDQELKNVEFLVGGNELENGLMGILGRNVLSVADTEYDLGHGEVRLTFPQGSCGDAPLAYWAGEAPVIVLPFEENRWRRMPDTAVRLEVKVNGKPLTALLDSGATRTSMTLKAARRAGIDESSLTRAGRAGGAGEGRATSWLGQVDTLQIGGETLRNNRLRIDDNDYADFDMLLGLDYFLSHRIYVSRLQQRVYATWNGSPIFDVGRAVAGEYNSRYAALPEEVAPDDAAALARRGAAAMAAGDHTRALQDLDRACELAPDVADNFLARARLLQTLREPRRALADLDQALRLDPALAEARMRRARLRATLGDRPGAQADLAALDAALAPSSNFRADMAAVYAGFAQLPDALRQYDAWVQTHPSDARLANVLERRCWLRTRLAVDLPLALQDCRRAVDLDAGGAMNHNSLGWTYLRLGDAAKARDSFDSALKLEAQAMPTFGRALAAGRLNDAAGAERDFAAARKLNPRIDDELRRLGFALVDGVLQAPASAP